jgi:hypothetical protein
MLRRNEALQKTADKFRGKPFVWGKYDCAKLARSHLRNMGHKPPVIAAYTSAVGAKTALKKTGHSDLESFFDALLPRISPAAMLPGDIALMEGDSAFDAVAVCVGRKVMAWHPDSEVTAMIVPLEIKAAWRA